MALFAVLPLVCAALQPRLPPGLSVFASRSPPGVQLSHMSAAQGRRAKNATAARQMDKAALGQFYREQECYLDGARPASAAKLGLDNFMRQGSSMLQHFAEEMGLMKRDLFCPPACLGLRLSNAEVAERSRKREAADEARGSAPPNAVAKALYDVGCFFLDNFFDERPIERFWFLETIARIPYFSYLSMLHLYESFGWWRDPELRKVHHAEEWNEMHHLLIMESLGGNAKWSDRFLGYHVAFVYYWLLIALYLVSPIAAYQFMELLESHAVDTYAVFAETNAERLAALPAPAVAQSYYISGDLYIFDDFQMRPPGSRRPPCATLLDVFTNIAQDEAEHVKTMQACQDYARLGSRVVSPHLRYHSAEEASERALLQEKRKAWKRWAEEVHNIYSEW